MTWWIKIKAVDTTKLNKYTDIVNKLPKHVIDSLVKEWREVKNKGTEVPTIIELAIFLAEKNKDPIY